MCENEATMYLFQLFLCRNVEDRWIPLARQSHRQVHDKSPLQIGEVSLAFHYRSREQTNDEKTLFKN